MESLAAEVGNQLLARRQLLALAESCTGGLIAKLVTDVAGSSAWFERGLVTYSNQSKQDLLGVPAEILRAQGAVSEPCARAMADGLLRGSPAHWGIAVTGIAGPAGGTPEKPVGLVWLALARRGTDTRTRELRLSGDREQIRAHTARTALQWLRDEMA
ncbi:MAG TPA: CinA family protein [Nevskiaceae bacterium]|nr:CinA family protein [Nevskiaceae bacterium]